MLDSLDVGQVLTRREVHERYGGRRQGGIGPSSQTPVVLFFTDPATGYQHGYYDGWGDDGLFHYVGEGQRGDQQLVQGNKSILMHRTEGRTLEGFRAEGTNVTYLGEFELVDHYFTDAHETADPTAVRQVVVFRLRPLGDLPTDLPDLPITPSTEPTVQEVPVEQQHTERAHVTPDREPYDVERREASLVQDYRMHLQGQGHQVSRLCVIPPGESRPLYSDLWDATTRELVEAKGSVTRDHLRQAVGQLLDYGRFADAKSHAVLVPSRPRADLLAYLAAANVITIFPDGGTYMRISADATSAESEALSPPTSPSAPGNDQYSYIVRRGDNAGAVLRPHIGPDGCYIVSTSRFARDQKRVPKSEPLAPWLQQGYKLRMSVGGRGAGASLISPEQIEGFTE